MSRYDLDQLILTGLGGAWGGWLCHLYRLHRHRLLTLILTRFRSR